MTDRRHEPTAHKIVQRIERARNPEVELEWTRDRLDRQLEGAERAKQHSEALLAELTERLARIASARRSAERASQQTHRLRCEQHEEQLLRDRNARRRQRYRERGEAHPSGSGKSVRIEIDDEAWRAFKSEVVKRRSTVKRALGEIVERLVLDAITSPGCEGVTGSRWRRTGAGRRATYQALVDTDDATWLLLKTLTVEEGTTLSSLLGRAIGAWT